MAIISRKRVNKYLNDADAATVVATNGKLFEDLIQYLFEKIPGITISKRNTLNTFQSEEIDIAFWNVKKENGLYFLSNILLVECKNWSSPVGSSEVNWFDAKLKRRGRDFGILVAANGITGDSTDISAAHEIIRTSLSEGRQIVVITRTEIESLNTTDQLVNLIQEKLCELAVSGTLFI